MIPDFGRIGKKLEAAEPLEMAILPFRAYVLVGQLQFALRHPENRGVAADIAKDIALRLQRLLGQIDPEIAQSLEHGWHPEFDVTKQEFEALEAEEGDRDAAVQCPECGNINTFSFVGAPSWRRCEDCQNDWQLEEGDQ